MRIPEISADPLAFKKASGNLLDTDPCRDPRMLQGKFREAVEQALDYQVRRSIEEFRTGQHPWLVVSSGLDLNDLPETPSSFRSTPHLSWWPLAWFTVGLMSLSGAQIVSYACENDGDAFVNLVTMPGTGDQVRLAEKSAGAMRGHTDAVSFPFPSEFTLGGEAHSPGPDLLVLACLRNLRGTPTKLASLGSALAQLSDEEVAALEGPFFDIKPQRTFSTDVLRLACPLISRSEVNGIAVRFSHSSVSACERAPPVAKQALERLQSILPGLYQDVALRPGQVCLVQNRLVIHGRSAPGAQVGGNSRWLLRTYGWGAETSGLRDATGPSHLHL